MEVTSQDIPMSADVFVGMAVTAHDDTTLADARFDRVSVEEAGSARVESWFLFY